MEVNLWIFFWLDLRKIFRIVLFRKRLVVIRKRLWSLYIFSSSVYMGGNIIILVFIFVVYMFNVRGCFLVKVWLIIIIVVKVEILNFSFDKYNINFIIVCLFVYISYFNRIWELWLCLYFIYILFLWNYCFLLNNLFLRIKDRFDWWFNCWLVCFFDKYVCISIGIFIV